MKPRCILSDYLAAAIARSKFEKLRDGSYSGSIPQCPGVVAFGSNQADCGDELRSTLEDWLLLGLKLGHPLPVIDDIDLNRGPVDESVESVQT
jgi:predicted RNase H-like HicB family nuclease